MSDVEDATPAIEEDDQILDDETGPTFYNPNGDELVEKSKQKSIEELLTPKRVFPTDKPWKKSSTPVKEVKLENAPAPVAQPTQPINSEVKHAPENEESSDYKQQNVAADNSNDSFEEAHEPIPHSSSDIETTAQEEIPSEPVEEFRDEDPADITEEYHEDQGTTNQEDEHATQLQNNVTEMPHDDLLTRIENELEHAEVYNDEHGTEEVRDLNEAVADTDENTQEDFPVTQHEVNTEYTGSIENSHDASDDLVLEDNHQQTGNDAEDHEEQNRSHEEHTKHDTDEATEPEEVKPKVVDVLKEEMREDETHSDDVAHEESHDEEVKPEVDVPKEEIREEHEESHYEELPAEEKQEEKVGSVRIIDFVNQIDLETARCDL